MHRPRLVFLWLFLGLPWVAACGGSNGKHDANGAYIVDQSDPVKVVQAVFDIAAGAAPTALGSLCDPLHQNDNDTQRICDEADGAAPESSFALYFGKGKALGKPRIQGDSAWFDLQYGPDGDHQSALCLIRRDAKWYLLRFLNAYDDQDAAL